MIYTKHNVWSRANTRQRALVGNLAVGGIAGSGGSLDEGIGGGIYIASLAEAGALDTLIFANEASTSNDNIFGILDGKS
jgi:hypothetical protein